MFLPALLASLAFASPPVDYAFYRISTIAGTGEAGFSGDEGPCLAAKFSHPTAIAIDAEGDLFVCDNHNNRIREITPDGTVRTVAGNGTAGFSGDGGPAINAELNRPYGIHLGANRVLYIADQQNNRIRKVDANGVITTVAGNGARGFSGDGGPAVLAALGESDDMVEDSSGGLIIADTNNDRLRRIDRDGRISTIAGNGRSRFFLHGAYAGDSGRAIDASLATPSNLSLDRLGNVYSCDFGTDVVRKISLDGHISTVLGTGSFGYNGDGLPAAQTKVCELGSTAFGSDGTMFFCDGLNYRIRCVTPDGLVHTIAGIGTRSFSGDGGLADGAGIGIVDSLALATDGSIYFADFTNNRIRKLTPITDGDPLKDPQVLLARMRRAYANLRHASIDNALPSHGRTQNPVIGHIEFTAPASLHAYYRSSDASYRVDCDGKTITVKETDGSRPSSIDYSARNLQNVVGANLEILCLFDAGFQLNPSAGGGMDGSKFAIAPDVEWNGRHWIELTESAGDLTVKYTIDPATYFIWRVRQVNGNGQLTYDGTITRLRR